MAIKSITRVSTSADGKEADETSFGQVFSPSGWKVAFESLASNLAPSDTNNANDIFIKDLSTGAIELISLTADGTQGNSNSASPVFSPDGTKVAFASTATNLDPSKRDGIFVKDLGTGTISLVSTDADGTPGNESSYAPVLFSSDGNRIAFGSGANNLVPGDTNGASDIFVKNLGTGEIERVSTSAAGMQGNYGSHFPAFSPDGNRIAFSSLANNLVPGDTNGVFDIFLKDLVTGSVTLISTDASGSLANDHTFFAPIFSPDGSQIAFRSWASNLVTGDTNNHIDIFVKNLTSGTIKRVSTAADGTEGNNNSNSVPTFSPNGENIAFSSSASNLVSDDTNNGSDIFVKEIATGAIARISVQATGEESNGDSDLPVFSPDGNQIAFSSWASNLVSGDSNGYPDIFIAELDELWVSPQSVRVSEEEGVVTFTVSRPKFGAAETIYVSTQQNRGSINQGDYNEKENVFLMFAAGEKSKTITVEIIDDNITEYEETFSIILQQAADQPTTSYVASATFTIEDNEEWPPPIKSITRISTAADGNEGNNSSGQAVFSPDGNQVAFASYASNLVPGDTNGSGGIFVKDLITGTNALVSTDADGAQGNLNSFSPAFSPDGTQVAFASYASNLVPGDTNNTSDIFIKNIATGAIQRISTAADGIQANEYSAPPVFSPDGTKVAFWSLASNLVPNDTNRTTDVFVKDLITGEIALVSTDADGAQGAYASASPTFSPDGRKIAFWSENNLVSNDTNDAGDIFVKDLATGTIERISTAADGRQGNSNSHDPVFSPDGSRIAFNSYASNLVPGDTNGTVDIFVKDLITGGIQHVSTTGGGNKGNGYSYNPVFSPDGSKVVFQSYATNLVPSDTNDWQDIFIKDLATDAIACLSISATGMQGNRESLYPTFSPDGKMVAFSSEASNLVPSDTNNSGDIFVVELADEWVSPALVTWSIAPQSVRINEGNGAAAFTIGRSSDALPQTVYVSTVENEGAANQGDYTAKLNESVVFAAGESEKTVAIDILDDAMAENDETFGLIVQQSPDQPASALLAAAIFTIADDDPAEPVNRIVGTARNDRLIGANGADVIDGQAGDDRLKGKDGNDILLGGRGDDRLDGGPGNDILIGGKGIDKLNGGLGVDLFVIDALKPGPDRILDFKPSEGDRLSLGPLIDSLGLRDALDVDALVGTSRAGKNIVITLDINGVDARGGVREVALLVRPEATDPQQILAYVDMDPLVLDSGDYWG